MKSTILITATLLMASLTAKAQSEQVVEAVSPSKQAELPLQNSPKFVLGETENTFTDGTNSTTFSAEERVVIRVKKTVEPEPEPQPTAEGYWPVATDGETEQYMLNIDAKAFMLGANDWGTRASVSIEHGYKVKVKANGDGTYTINDYVESRNTWNALDCQSAGGIWVDGKGRGGWMQWVVTPVAGAKNVYEITNTNVPGKLGVKSDLSDTRLYVNNESGYATRWAFMDEAGYNAYLEARKEEIEREKQERLNAQNALSLAAQKAIIDGTNIYEQDGYNAYVAQYEAYMASLAAGTLKEVVVNPNTATGWHASTAYNFLLTPWTIGGEKANNFDKALYINTWSVEGESDGSNFLVPFHEYWTSDDRSLAQNVISTSIGNLHKGDVYEVTILARVRIRNGATNPTGITMAVGNGKSINLCAGEQVGSTQMYLAEFTAKGNVDSKGDLNIAINIAADNNISWLAFKNVKYALKEVATLTGDVNKDGVVDMIDMTRLIYILVHGMSSAYDIRDVDINGDGAINQLDVIALQKIILNRRNVIYI